MHPLTELRCEELLNNPLLRTPPLQPENPRPPRIRQPRTFHVMARFPLLPEEFYLRWAKHQKSLHYMRSKVDTKPPLLFPEQFLKPRRLNVYGKKIEDMMRVNRDLLKKINLIHRNGGMVDCWQKGPSSNCLPLQRKRQSQLDEIRRTNITFYSRLLDARSDQPTAAAMDKMWEKSKEKLIMSASQPFVLFGTEKIDRGYKDPKMDRPLHVSRPRVLMSVRVKHGSKIGLVTVELFTDIVPRTCKLFMTLVRGDGYGHAYTGTRIFRIVPNLYCRGGDVTKDNGFGCYLPMDSNMPMGAENFHLKHTVPGTLSMVVTPENEVCGQFNIIFKPLPQFDGKHIVFGRIISGPSLTLERISALGNPRGTTTSDVMLDYCGWISKSGAVHTGDPSTVHFNKDLRRRPSVIHNRNSSTTTGKSL